MWIIKKDRVYNWQTLSHNLLYKPDSKSPSYFSSRSKDARSPNIWESNSASDCDRCNTLIIKIQKVRSTRPETYLGINQI